MVINLKKAITVKEFNYEMIINGVSTPIRSAVLVIPNGVEFAGEPCDLAIGVEDVDGKGIFFETVRDAQRWLDKNLATVKVRQSRDGVTLIERR